MANGYPQVVRSDWTRMDHSWRDRAACKPPPHLKGQERVDYIKKSYEIFFPEQGDSIKEAERICGSCPVKQHCIEYALITKQHIGFYGSPDRPRRRTRRQKTIIKNTGEAANPELLKRMYQEIKDYDENLLKSRDTQEVGEAIHHIQSKKR